MLAYLTIFTTSFVIAFSGAMMPGPLLTTTIGESARQGPWVGPKMIAGHAVLELILLLGLFLGLTPLLKNEIFFIVVAILGGGIMIWMARGMFHSIPKLELSTLANTKSQINVYLAGILMSLANPYWIIWWATIGLGYVLHSQKFGIAGVAMFFVGHIFGDLVWYSSISFAIGKGKKIFSNKVYRILIGSCATFLVLFSFWLIYDGVQRILRF